MKSNLFLIFLLCILNYAVFGNNLNTNKGSISKNKMDTIVIQDISKEVYICTCKPNTCNPNGGGMIFFQGKYIEDRVTPDANYKNCDERFLIQWDLSELPDGINIVEAKMELFCSHFSGDKQGQLVYEYITEPWKADIGYAKKPTTSIDGRVLTDWPKAEQFHIVDITNFIKNWHYKKIPNYGLMGYSINTETTNSAIFCSSMFPDKALCPKLIIVFQKN